MSLAEPPVTCPQCSAPFTGPGSTRGIAFKADGTVDWWSAKCGRCGYHREKPGATQARLRIIQGRPVWSDEHR